MRTPNGKWSAVASLLAIAAFAGGYGVTAILGNSSLEAPQREIELNGAESDYVDFGNPYAATRRLSDVGEARLAVAFEPVAPSSFGTPAGIYTAADITDRAAKTIALVYKDAEVGTFMIVEGPKIGGDSDFSALVEQCASSSACEDDWHTTKLSDGTVAVVHVASSGRSHATTGVLWFSGDRSLDLSGPAETLTEATALALANQVQTAASS